MVKVLTEGPAGPARDLCAGPVCSCLKRRKRPHPHPRSASRSLSLPPALCQSPGKTGKTWPSPQRGGNDLFACCQLHTRHVPTEVLNGSESGAGNDNGQPKRHVQGHPSGRMERKDRRFAVQSLFLSGGAVHFSLWFCGQVRGLCSLAGRKASRSAGKALQLRMVLGYFAMSNN